MVNILFIIDKNSKISSGEILHGKKIIIIVNMKINFLFQKLIHITFCRNFKNFLVKMSKKREILGKSFDKKKN